MSDIIQRTFGEGNNKCLTLDGKEWCRKLTIGNNWTRIRIGMLRAYTPNGTSNITSVIHTMGVCSGTAAPFSAASTTNFIGGQFNSILDAGNDFTYSANSGNPVYSAAQGGCAIKRVATTNTRSAVYSSNGVVQAATNGGSTQRKTSCFIDITKGSPNYSIIQIAVTNAVTAANDFPVAQFRADLATSGTPANHSASDTKTIAMDESAGILDSVCIYWNKALFPLEIYDIRAFRFS